MSSVTMDIVAVLACGDGAWGSADSVDAAVGQVSALETDAMGLTGYQGASAVAGVAATWREFTRSCAGTTREIGNKLKSSAYAVQGADSRSLPEYKDEYLRVNVDGVPTSGTTWTTGAQ